MKRYLLLPIFIVLPFIAKSQSWFERKVKIRQSLESADLETEPAQLQLTLPKDSSSYLVDLGVAISLDKGTSKFNSSFNIEYHRNSLIDEAQNNLQAGYGYKLQLIQKTNTSYFLTGDLKYVKNKEDEKHSGAIDLLFTWVRDSGKGLYFNTDNFLDTNGIHAINPSVFLGLQGQNVFRSDKGELEGFTLRPTLNVNLSYSLNKKHTIPKKPILTFSSNYTARVAGLKPSGSEEKYTGLFKASLDYVIVNEPVSIKIGPAYNNGSDPLAGLEKQSYWQVSLKILK